MRQVLASLNPDQRQAVKTTEGPLLVLAGAGTGKTRVITVRMAHLLQKRVPAREILAVTFTNKAAEEMRERVGKLVTRKRAEHLTIGTFHAFCLRILREHGAAIGLGSRFSICDSADQLSAVKGALRDLRVPEATIQPRALQAEISLFKNRLMSSDGVLEGAVDDRDQLVGHAYRRYNENLQRSRVLDFDDLLLKTVELLDKDRKTLEHLQKRFRYVMVDEYQDTNGVQYEIVRRLAEKHRNICVVGDDDQSIYGWRGADVKRILGFERDFPGAEVVRLQTNYRSTQPILDMANRVIRNNPVRHDKALRSALGAGERVKMAAAENEEKEARGVAADIVERVRSGKSRWADCSVLFRAAAQARAFEAALRSYDVPYVLVGGMSFFDRKEVRDVLAYLKLAVNPDDEVSLLRIVNTPPRGVGKTTIERVLAHATERGWPVSRAFDEAHEIDGVAPAAAASVEELRGKLADHAEPTGALRRHVKSLIDAVDYRAEVERLYADTVTRDTRWAGVLEILEFADNYERRTKKPTLEGFLEQLTLFSSDDDRDDRKAGDVVTLMTLHAAKGLEFPHVYLVGLEEGILPHEKSVSGDSVEEERRLMYVGITRAQRALTMSFSRARSRYGKRTERMPSRFLYEAKGEAPPDSWHACGQEPPAAKKPKKRRRRR
ncbi:MAG: ATP-dependent helicase [Planctomycetota bacterium]